MPYPYEYPFAYDESVQGNTTAYASSVFGRVSKSALRAISPMWVFVLGLIGRFF